MLIKEMYQLATSDTDILAAPSRLAAIPQDGVMTIEASSTDCDTANNGVLTLQLPDGFIPFENLLVPQNGFSTADTVIHDDTAFQVAFEVEQGGHVLLSYTETGTVALFVVSVTLEF